MKKFILSIKGGKIENPTKLAQHIKSVKDGIYKLIMTKQGTRSKGQNNYYWGVVLHLIEEYTGTPAEELHYYFKHKFIDGEEFPSTAELNKMDMASYVDAIRDFASMRFGIYIPDPNENYDNEGL